MAGGAVVVILLPMFGFLFLFPIFSAISVAYRLHGGGTTALYRVAKWGPIVAVFGGLAVAFALSKILPSDWLRGLSIVMTTTQVGILLASVWAIARLSHAVRRYITGTVLVVLCLVAAALFADGAGLTRLGTPRLFLLIAYYLSQLFS
jgi:hypothetical protein